MAVKERPYSPSTTSTCSTRQSRNLFVSDLKKPFYNSNTGMMQEELTECCEDSAWEQNSIPLQRNSVSEETCLKVPRYMSIDENIDENRCSNPDKSRSQKIQPPEAGKFKMLLQAKPPKMPCRYASIEANVDEDENHAPEVTESQESDEVCRSYHIVSAPVMDKMRPTFPTFPRRRSLMSSSRVSSMSSVTYGDSEFDDDMDYEMTHELFSSVLIVSTDGFSDQIKLYDTSEQSKSLKPPRRRSTIKFGYNDFDNDNEESEMIPMMPKRRSTINLMNYDLDVHLEEDGCQSVIDKEEW